MKQSIALTLSSFMLLALPAFMAVATGEDNASAQATTMEVHKSPTCGCCKNWIAHMQEAGFAVTPVDHANLFSLKMEAGVREQYQSCHTGIIDGYVFEGHVPAKFVLQFLQSPAADAIGLSVPAMPVGTPGMEMGGRFSPYDILLLKKDGSAEVYASIASYDEQF